MVFYLLPPCQFDIDTRSSLDNYSNPNSWMDGGVHIQAHKLWAPWKTQSGKQRRMSIWECGGCTADPWHIAQPGVIEYSSMKIKYQRRKQSELQNADSCGVLQPFQWPPHSKGESQDCPPQDWPHGGQSWGGQFWALSVIRIAHLNYNTIDSGCIGTLFTYI